MRYLLLLSLATLTIIGGLSAGEKSPVLNQWVGFGSIGGGPLLSQAGDEGRNVAILQALQTAEEPVPLFLLGTYVEGDARYATNTTNAEPTRNASELFFSQGDSASTLWVDAARLYLLAGEKSIHAQVGIDFASESLIRSAMLLFGDLDHSSFYGGIGIDFVWFSPFISDSAYSDSLNEILFRPSNVPQAVVGYVHKGFEASFTVFQAAHGSGRLRNASQINDFAIQASKQFDWKRVAWEVGVGYINNLKAVGGSDYRGSLNFAITDDDNRERVPAVDAYVRGSWEKFAFIVEYNGALEGCLQRSGRFESPQALAIEGEYLFKWKKPMSVVLSFSATWDADIVQDATLPDFDGAGFITQKQQYLLSWISCLTPNVEIGLEGAYERNYSGDHNLVATAVVGVSF